jgi:hypothetical protein
MKLFKNKFLMILSMASLVMFTSCGGKSGDSSVSGINAENGPKTPEKSRVVRLGEAENFAVLAYANVSSIPQSNINGKVGLMPGTRDMITMDPSEVAGGAADIMGSDDETNPLNILSNAKVDMVTAYSKAVSLTADADKINMLEESLNGKVLKGGGVYRFEKGLVLSSDLTLDGTEEDVWVFQIPAHLTISSGVQVKLANGAKARNVLWQVAGSAVLESGSSVVGTIIAQPSIELRSKSTLYGRAFCKNGYVALNQATIKLP